MASRRRCETLTATSTSRRGGAVGGELAQTSSSKTSVSLATTGSDSEPTGLRQAEEGRVSPTAGGRRRVLRGPTASRYFLRSTQIPTCAGVSGAGPGLRPATSSTKATASETRSRLRSSNRAERQTSGESGSSRRASQKRGKKIQDPKQRLPPRMKRKEVKDRLLNPRETQRFGTWNVRTLRGTGKPELLANEMKRYKLSIVAVTETHLAGEGEMPLDEEGKYIILFSGRQDGQNVEGVGLALSSQAQAAMRHHQSISPRIMTAEFLTQVGPLMIVVVYAPTDRASNEEKDKFYEDLNCVVSRGHGHVMVMGDFNASVSDKLHGVVGPYGLGSRASENGERLVSFACVNGLCVTNTFFPHKRIHQATWYPPDPSRAPSLKDYILVKPRLMASVLDTRVFRGADIDSDHRLVVTSIRLKLQQKRKEKRGRCFDVKLLQEGSTKADFLNTFTKCFDTRKREGSVGERWNELKQSIMESAEEHLQCKRRKQKIWMSDDTLHLVDMKRKAYNRWHECRTDVERQREYRSLRLAVRKAVRKDREAWLNAVMEEMEDSLKRHRQGDFFRKLRDLNASRVKPTSTIWDERGHPIQTSEERLSRWKRHFEGVLNVPNTVAAEVIANVEDLATTDTTEVTREEGRRQ